MAGGIQEVPERKTGEAATKFVERPMEPVVANGRGMRVLGFVPLSGLRTKSLHAPESPHEAQKEALPKEEDTAPTAETPVASHAKGTTSPDEQPIQNRKEKQPPEEQDQQQGAEKGDKSQLEDSSKGTSDGKKGHDGYKSLSGSYQRYYGYRHSGTESGALDRRLAAVVKHMGKDFFEGKEVLDIGCNAGAVSLAVVKELKASRVVGMDVDDNLIAKAKAAAAAAAAVSDQVPNVEFRSEDILHCPLKRPPSMLPERFDVITLLSVTKWVHFAHGDWGIRRLFKRCVKRLKPGGTLVLEPQEWHSYRKKRGVSAEISQTVASIELRPQDFPKYLEELGLQRQSTIEPPKDVSKGFQRSIYLFTRPEPEDDDEEVAEEHGVREEDPGPKQKKAKRKTVEAEDATGAEEEAAPGAGRAKAKTRRKEGVEEEEREGEQTEEQDEQAERRRKKKVRTAKPSLDEPAQEEATPAEEGLSKRQKKVKKQEESGQPEEEEPEDGERPKKRKRKHDVTPET